MSRYSILNDRRDFFTDEIECKLNFIVDYYIFFRTVVCCTLKILMSNPYAIPSSAMRLIAKLTEAHLRLRFSASY